MDNKFSNLTIKDLVKDNKKVNFVFYRANELWYETTDGFIFPVPISDINDTTFLKEDKAILFMRWIRPYFLKMKNSNKER
jgi:hypothetical protein